MAYRAELKVKSIILSIKKLLKNWTQSVDLKKTRILQLPSFIFLCGGKISSDEEIFYSCRDIFYSHIKEHKYSYFDNVILAENVFDYFKLSEYKDLLSFEKDLASLSALTIIFSESPGSIAELGSFSVLEYIRDRLLVVIHSDDAYSKSFIWQGPISYLNNVDIDNRLHESISVYNWNKIQADSNNKSLSRSDFGDADHLSKNVGQILNKINKTSTFTYNHAGHIMILIVEALSIIQIATMDDIEYFISEFLSEFNYPIKVSKIKQYLNLLASLNIISLVLYGHNKFYVASNPEINWIKWSYKENIDTLRWQITFADFIENVQRDKYRALKSYKTKQNK